MAARCFSYSARAIVEGPQGARWSFSTLALLPILVSLPSPCIACLCVLVSSVFIHSMLADIACTPILVFTAGSDRSGSAVYRFIRIVDEICAEGWRDAVDSGFSSLMRKIVSYIACTRRAQSRFSAWTRKPTMLMTTYRTG